MTLRRVNVLILVLLSIAFLIILHRNLLNLSDFLKQEDSDAAAGMILPFESGFFADHKIRTGEEIPVVITAAEERLGAVVAAMNSINRNTGANVVFNIVTLNESVAHLRAWLTKTDIKHKIITFEPKILEGKISNDPQKADLVKPLTFARFYMPLFIPDAEKVIYLDDDVIVQGDIRELFETSLKAGHAAAFSDDCDSASSKGFVRGAGNQAIQLLCPICLSREDLYSRTLADSFTTPPLLIVFYKHHSSLDPMWHVRHLGAVGAGNRYSPQFVRAAKLLHWNGHYKPWGRAASFSDIWDKWYIPDPTGKFHPIRRHPGDK
ncbi:hypothetical protein P4O66_006427 [Electrophorus voltai]|uniref:Glycosyltransferase 8 domain-containing protein 1 n=1 Tax=Electrophorus voltai TaxID=2609070 RepID=A0AAD8ZLZ5_9TELE|nr:hypothetical protein P4O66_006427 [Electrophorus voltai]